MKYFLFFFIIISSAFSIQAQNSWQIIMNKKMVLTGNDSNELPNTRNFNPSDWTKKGYLEINFKEAIANFWKRSFQFDDETGNQLFSKDSTTKVKIPLRELRKIYAGKKEIKIYTVASPLDPNIAVRMQRVHLCTLKLQ
jgi:hypothetical protein